MIKSLQPQNKILHFPKLELSTDQTNKFICLAGENGSGKTTIIKLLEQYAKNKTPNNMIEFEKQTDFLTKTNSIFIKHNDINTPVHKANDNSTIDEEVIVDPKITYRSNTTEHTIDGFGYPSDHLTTQKIVDGLMFIRRLTNDEFTKIIRTKKGVDGEQEYKNLPISKFQSIINEYFNVSFKFDIQDDHWFSSSESNYDINNLSTGEQQAFLMATKIFIQLSIFRKHSLINETIYLFIDEIEAYLHPKWQYKVLLFLKSIVEIFTENYQFIFSTHSREIIDSSMQNDEIRKQILIINLSRNVLKNTIAVEYYDHTKFLIGGTAEINYKIFHIPTIEYYLALYEFKKGTQSYKQFEPNLQKQCNLLIAKNASEKQTYLSRIRHLIAHGANQFEDGYVWFNKNKLIADQPTKDFYQKWFSEKRLELLECAIQDLSKII